MKVFHDFCEDAAAIVNQFKVQPVNVFDTQIAHRLIKEAEEFQGSKRAWQEEHELDKVKKYCTSLNDLLSYYLNVAND